MKICWDNLEKLKYITKTGNFKLGTNTFHFYEKCSECGYSYLGKAESKYCSAECRMKSKIATQKLRESNIGRKFSKEHKQKLHEVNLGNRNRWRGGISVKFNNISTYDTYAHRLEPYEQCRRNADDPNILEVKCTYCGKWYVPTIVATNNRISGVNKSNNRFYCSDGCKQECPIYGRRKYYKGQEGYNSREVQPELRQMSFARDDYICVKCGSNGPLHCHHIDPVANNPIESADVDNCITLCVGCHKEAHQLPGCGYSELKNCNKY
jgi:5-methylcytosine-specific restriction endonuclease McrA